MKKLSSEKTDKLILKYIIKILVSTIASILLFTFIFSEITYKLDLSLDTARIFSIIICALSAFCVSFISLTGMKNNGLALGIISQLPLIFYSLINLIFNDNSIVIFIIKLVIIILVGALGGLIRTKHSKRFKI